MTLVFTIRVYEDMLAHAREGAPEEVCGVLGGTAGEATRVTVAHRVPNVAESPTGRYELDPAAQVRAMDAIEADGGEVVGFYHSHPRGPSGPSAVDETLATWPGYAYVIVSLPGPAVGGWRWTGDRFEAERVRVQSA